MNVRLLVLLLLLPAGSKVAARTESGPPRPDSLPPVPQWERHNFYDIFSDIDVRMEVSPSAMYGCVLDTIEHPQKGWYEVYFEPYYAIKGDLGKGTIVFWERMGGFHHMDWRPGNEVVLRLYYNIPGIFRASIFSTYDVVHEMQELDRAGYLANHTDPCWSAFEGKLPVVNTYDPGRNFFIETCEWYMVSLMVIGLMVGTKELVAGRIISRPGKRLFLRPR